jgi:hypothetical protein
MVFSQELVHGQRPCAHDQPRLLRDIEASDFAWLCGLVWDQQGFGCGWSLMVSFTTATLWVKL